MATRPTEGQPAPSFSLPTNTGDAPVTLSDYRD
ncbi:MAG: peroxiredoxin, partial [Fibrella sp.]|nr:peroxiredoxin [Armatimonadota bacterium]